MSMSEPNFTIVVIGRNEGSRLRDCLQSAFRVCAKVVYADSASTDGSIELARSMGAHVVCVDPSRPLNAARGRNAGIDLVKLHFPECEFVQFIDGDCLLIDTWVKIAIDFLERHPKAAVVCGRRFEAHAEASLYNRLADQEWNTPVGLAQSCGGDAMMRMSAFEEVGGFNPALMASEEPELSARLRERGWEIWRLEALMTEHDARMLTFVQWWRRTFRSGYGYAQAWLTTRDLPHPVNQRLLQSALLWVIGVPVLVLMLAFAARAAVLVLLLPIAYLMQVVRIAYRRSELSARGIRTSSMLMFAKLPELIGAVIAIFGPRSKMIEYKTSATKSSRDAT